MRNLVNAGKNSYIVNSRKVLDRLALLVPQEDMAKLTIAPTDYQGLYLLTMSHPMELDIKKLLQDIGATPSPYQIYKLPFVNQARVKFDADVDNIAKLDSLLTSSGFRKVKRLAGLPGGQGVMQFNSHRNPVRLGVGDDDLQTGTHNIKGVRQR